MSLLHDKLEALLPVWRAELQRVVAQHGEHVVDRVTVGQVLGGMRGIRGLVCDTSSVDPQQGLFLRGIPVLDLVGRDGDDMFWLLLTGELPDGEARLWMAQEHARRLAEPTTIQDVLTTLPEDMHPTTQYAILLMARQHESRFAQAYGHVPKHDLWRYALDDALNLRVWSRMIEVRISARYKQARGYPPDAELAWGAGFDRYSALRALYEVVHSDHENGNASAFACHAVGSALADPLLALVASINALAGPIHGKAAQTCLEFIQQLGEQFGSEASAEQVRGACWARLNARQIIPGFGHAVLRGEDPRFVALKRFGDEHCADEPLYRLASMLYRVAPEVLLEHGAASSPHPNVDAIGGVLLWCCGLRRPEFFTIMFSLGQMNGLLANYVLARGLGLPIMRPRSASLAQLRELASSAS